VSALERLRRPRVAIAWLLFAACAFVVLFLGTDRFSAATTGGIFGPIIEWAFPGWSAGERWAFHVKLRRLAHATEYGVLALCAFHAVLVTLESVPARIAGIAFVLVVLVAAMDETRQSLSLYRDGSFGDVALDLAGALVALGIAVLLHRRRDRQMVAGAP
jgi:hypothetical protein